eukprot:gene8915-biopygen8856
MVFGRKRTTSPRGSAQSKVHRTLHWNSIQPELHRVSAGGTFTQRCSKRYHGVTWHHTASPTKHTAHTASHSATRRYTAPHGAATGHALRNTACSEPFYPLSVPLPSPKISY